jgi:amidase
MPLLRTLILVCAGGALVLASQAAPRRTASQPAFSVVEATIPQLRAAMEQGRVSSREIVTQYLIRIAMYDGHLHAALAVSRSALQEAGERDRERAAGRVRGPLHGIPIALKDNIHTTTMPTTGGALAFARLVPPYAATVTKNLEDAGAIIIAKTGMTELANWVAGEPTPMPGNYNAIHGFGTNPYDPRRDPRLTADGRPVLSPAGSSSGIGTAASLWAASVGTETSGSILTPANQTMLAAVKPTVGRISRHGIIPITADQDTAGPMARSVTDAAILLGVLEGAAPDANDPATRTCPPPPRRDYTVFLQADALRGARIGIPRAFFYESSLAGRSPGAGDARARLMADAIAVLRQRGALIVDPANIPSVVATEPDRSFLRWNICSGVNAGKGSDAGCSTVLKYGMKRDFNKWLASLGGAAPLPTLSALRAWNLDHRNAGAIKYGQSNLDISDEIDLVADRARYEADRAKDLMLTATEGIDRIMQAERLDALLFPGSSGSALAARPGYPTVIVPFGFVPNVGAFPPGFDPRPEPFGVSFTGTACSEPRLLALAYAFEQATRKRVPPGEVP